MPNSQKLPGGSQKEEFPAVVVEVYSLLAAALWAKA